MQPFRQVPDMADIRMGLIGIGSMGRHHARVIRETEGMQLVAIADPGGDRFGVAKGLEVLPDVDALIAAGIDAAMVAVPTIHHEEVALKLAAAGIPTMVEKPIAASVAAGERVAEAFDQAGIVGAVGYVERCNPAVIELRRRLQLGQLGQIYQITTSRQGPFPARISDVGVVKDLATHDIDLVKWLGGANYADVNAQVAFRSGRPNEDMMVAAGVLTNGIIVGHVVNWLSPRKERQVIVTGEKGALIADTATTDLTFHANGTVATEWDAIAAFRGVTEGDVIRYAFTKREPLKVEQEYFRDAINGDPSGIVSMADGVETLRIIERMLQSSHNQRP